MNRVEGEKRPAFRGKGRQSRERDTTPASRL